MLQPVAHGESEFTSPVPPKKPLFLLDFFVLGSFCLLQQKSTQLLKLFQSATAEKQLVHFIYRLKMANETKLKLEVQILNKPDSKALQLKTHM